MKLKMLWVALVPMVWLAWRPPAATGSPGAAAAQETPSRKPTLKEKVLEIPPESVVEVRLKNKEKVRGRLGDISNEAFVVKVATPQGLQNRAVRFDDVKSMKKYEGKKALRVVGYSALAIGVGVGVILAAAGIFALVAL